MSQENPTFNAMRHEGTTPINSPITERYALGIQSYLEDAARSQVLRPRQHEVFQDFQTFFQKREKRGRVLLPTGTGKTVLMVELSKALQSVPEEEGPKPKILVVVPTKDLVHQTLGKSGEKGFGKFAPGINIGSFFSDTPEKERRNPGQFDVVVTTYRSFQILNNSPIYRPVVNFEEDVLQSEFFKRAAYNQGYNQALRSARNMKAVPTEKKQLSLFDIIILDEAHHTHGEGIGTIVDAIPEDKVVIGFTATPDVNELKKLSNRLPYKIHELGLNEAMALGLLATMYPIGVKSGMKIKGSQLYSEDGEFLDSRMGYLAESPERNAQIIKSAQVLAEENIGTIISCIAGNEAWHARFLAELLRKNGVKAQAVHASIPAEERQKIFRLFDEGKIEVLTFIGVLGEGWDSTRAKSIINARPSRSHIFTTQRLGRITRPGHPAFSLDIVDEYEERNPAITVADVLKEGPVLLGHSFGTDEDTTQAFRVIERLKQQVSVLDVLENTYEENEAVLATLQELFNGSLFEAEDKKRPTYALPSVLHRSYSGVTEEMIAKIEEISGVKIAKKVARQGQVIRTVYKIDQAAPLIATLPLVDPEKYYVDNKREKWMSNEGIVQLFSKRYPQLTLFTVQDLLSTSMGLNWIPARFLNSPKYGQYKHYRAIPMYKVEQKTIDTLNQLFSDYFQYIKLGEQA